MSTCSSCGAEIPNNVAKCPKCFPPTGAVLSTLINSSAAGLGAVFGGVIGGVFFASVLMWGGPAIVGGILAGAAIGMVGGWWLSS